MLEKSRQLNNRMTEYIKEHLNENNQVDDLQDSEDDIAMNLKPNIESEDDLIEEEGLSQEEDDNDENIQVEFEEEDDELQGEDPFEQNYNEKYMNNQVNTNNYDDDENNDDQEDFFQKNTNKMDNKKQDPIIDV